MTDKKLKIVACVPAYGEEATIGSVVPTAKGYVDRVIVIDDGSTDKTAKVAELAGAEVIKHEKNRGYGGAIKTCFDAAKKYDADIMVIADADAQHNPSDIPTLTKKITEENADIVIGSRFLDNSTKIPIYRSLGIKVLNKATNLSAHSVSDTQSGFRAYSRTAIHMIELANSGMGAGSEILMEADKLKLKIVEVPISVRYDVGKHSLNPLSHGASVLGTILGYIEEKHPLAFFGTGGIVFLVAGVGLGFWVVERYNQLHQVAIGNAIVTAIFIIIGIFSIFSGIIIHTIVNSLKPRK